jgi:hypothetical protein
MAVPGGDYRPDTSVDSPHTGRVADGHDAPLPPPAPRERLTPHDYFEPRAVAPPSPTSIRPRWPAGKLRKLLAAHEDGLSASALAKEANASLDQVNTLLREMEAESQVKRTGERRGMRWHAA